MKKPSSGVIVRICLIGLPVGTIVLGVISMVWSAATGNLIHDTESTNDSLPSAAAPGLPVSQRTEALENWVNILSTRIGERNSTQKANLDASRYWIQSTLGINNIGYRVEVQSYEVRGETYFNVIAELRGEEKPEEIVIVGAHYDTAAGTPGANDNGTGVAALISLADGFMERPQDRTIRFVAFTNEEPPWFQTRDMGSLRYAQKLKEDGEEVMGMISLESLGYFTDEPGSQNYPEAIADDYPDTGNFLAFVSNPQSQDLLQLAFRTFTAHSPLPAEQAALPPILPGVGWSDHWSFWEEGYPAIMVTDTAIFRDPNYHKPTDQPDKIDFERFALAVDGLEHVIRAMARSK